MSGLQGSETGGALPPARGASPGIFDKEKKLQGARRRGPVWDEKERRG